MNTLRVQWFAAYRDATGVATESVQSAAPTVADLYTELLDRHPGLSAYRRALVAVNDQMKDWNAALEDGDEVLFFPPVAGG